MDNISALPMRRDHGEDDEPDSALVWAAQAHPAAFAHLHQRYETRVYRFLRTRTDSAEDAADLTQQVFLQALDSLPRYRERGTPFAAWLFRIARNVAIDHHRRKRPTVGWDLLPEALHPVNGQDLETAVVDRETRDQLREALARLDAGKRELVSLRFVARLTIPEIASVLGKSESTVHRQLRDVLRTLKESFDER